MLERIVITFYTTISTIHFSYWSCKLYIFTYTYIYTNINIYIYIHIYRFTYYKYIYTYIYTDWHIMYIYIPIYTYAFQTNLSNQGTTLISITLGPQDVSEGSAVRLSCSHGWWPNQPGIQQVLLRICEYGIYVWYIYVKYLYSM